jgi:hypothetical protein
MLTRPKEMVPFQIDRTLRPFSSWIRRFHGILIV